MNVLRDNGSSGCSVKQCLVRPEEYTGRQIQVKMIDGSVRLFPEAQIQVTSPFFTGSTVAVVMPQPLFDLIIGNIKGAKNSCAIDVATQTSAIAVMPQDLFYSQDIVQEQQSDPTLAGVHRKLQGNVIKHSRGCQARFLHIQGRLYRASQTPQGEVRTQFVVPAKYRRAVCEMGHSAVLGGHVGQRKTFDYIQAGFFWPGMGRDISKFVRSCEVCQRTTVRGRVPSVPLQPHATIPVQPQCHMHQRQ